MQRGDDFQSRRAEDLFGEMSADGVGDRVMDVQDLELLVIGDFGHLRGQRQRVRRIRIEQWIRRDGDFMKMHALVKDVEARRQGVADEVDVIAPARERDSELGGHNAGAAECRVTRDAYSHETSRPPYAANTSSIRGGCFVTNASPYRAPISAPKCFPRASIISKNRCSAMNVLGSTDFGLKNCDLYAPTAFIFVFHESVTSMTKLIGGR